MATPAAAVRQELGDNFDLARFIPFVIMHEFEGLLFSDCQLFAQGVERRNLAQAFQTIRNQFICPEEINDSVETAPSKRIKAAFPAYNKPLHGVFAALEIGLDVIRRECPHFGGWLTRLEAYGQQRSALNSA